MVSKCGRIAEVVAIMEMAQVGVTTRARAALAMGGSTASATTASAERKPKRRRINSEQLKFSASSSPVQLKGRSRPDIIQPEADDQQCSCPSSDDELPSSCCSSNGSIGLDEERIEFVDLEVQSSQVETSTSNCVDEREMSPSNEFRGPSSEEEVKPAEANARCIPTVQKMPTEQELEEFFAAAESDIQKRFAEKYSYDIVKDVPLEGRYEWVQIKP